MDRYSAGQAGKGLFSGDEVTRKIQTHGDVIIDAHVHVWSDDRRTFPMVPGRERPLEVPASAGELIQRMDAHGVAKALAVQAPWYSDNRYLVEAIARFRERLVGIGYLDNPERPDVVDLVRHEHEMEGLRGVRIHLTTDGVASAFANNKLDSVLRTLCDLNVPLKLRAWMTHAGIIEAAARRFSSLTFVIDHLMHPSAREAPNYPGASGLLGLALLSNVYVQVSELHRMSKQSWPWLDTHKFLEAVTDRFGARRLLWGSDFPMQSSEISYSQRLDAARGALSFLSHDELALVLGGNAASIWGLDS